MHIQSGRYSADRPTCQIVNRRIWCDGIQKGRKRRWTDLKGDLRCWEIVLTSADMFRTSSLCVWMYSTHTHTHTHIQMYRKSSEKEGVYIRLAGNGTDNKSYYYCCCGPLWFGRSVRRHMSVYNKYRTNQHKQQTLTICAMGRRATNFVLLSLFGHYSPFFPFLLSTDFLADLRSPPPPSYCRPLIPFRRIYSTVI